MHLRICFRYVCHASVSEKNFPDGTQAVSSNQALPRHTRVLTYCCFLPDLTRFTVSYCAGPKPCERNHQKAISCYMIILFLISFVKEIVSQGETIFVVDLSVFEFCRPLFEECCHSFNSVFSIECSLECFSFETHSCSQVCIHTVIDS